MMLPNLTLPVQKFPVYIIGAGGIVNDAHLPAYSKAGFNVAGIYDIDITKAKATAKKICIADVFDSLQQLIEHADSDAVFDIALPASAYKQVLPLLPRNASVLIQKPMGETMADAIDILAICREKNLNAGVNFQLRYAPFIMAARNIIDQGLIGTVCDIEVNVNVYMPWHLWTFLYQAPRVEILYHSIHYIDVIRTFLGNPKSVFAKTVKHPLMQELASVRSNIILDYGDYVRANIITNHCHRFGLQNQHAYLKIEGTKGAIKLQMGAVMNYPGAMPDTFEYIVVDENNQGVWQTISIEGSWFPDAFIGSMTQVMLAKEGTISNPDNTVEDALVTMACVEAAYQANSTGGVDPMHFLLP
ncbi:MAG: Gfo/Idh/MocA family oxidoreductase [Bacteroidota bacterium]